MWERTLSQKIVNKLCEQDVIDTCDAAAYVYGYELLISSVISVLIVVLVSIICGDFRYSLSFLLGFVLQRIYIGGYHATSHIRCYFAFSGMFDLCFAEQIDCSHLYFPHYDNSTSLEHFDSFRTR